MRPWSLATLALLLTGCGSEAPQQPVQLDLVTGQPVRTVVFNRPMLGPLPAPPMGTGMGYRSDFVRAFTDGLIIDLPGERITVSVRDAGTVTFSEPGPLMVDDPVGPDVPVELPLKLPAEQYPVEVSRVRIEPKDGSPPIEQIAAARILVESGTAVDWHWIGQYGLESGLGSFLAPTAAEAMRTRQDAITAAIVSALEDDPLAAQSIGTRPAFPADLCFFPAGVGEGSVEIYVGVDADGKPVEVVADFLILVEPEEIVAEIKDPGGWPPGHLPAPALEELGIIVRRAHPDEAIPTTGAPCWIEIDARSIARDPRIGFPRLKLRDADGTPLMMEPVTEGYMLWLQPPPDGLVIGQLAIVLQMGVKPL